MPLNLHPSCVVRLEELLVDAIGQLRATNGSFLDWSSVSALAALDDALPRRDKQTPSLFEMIDDRPLSDFAADRIHRILKHQGVYVKEPSQAPLNTLDLFKDPRSRAHDIIADFNSLPWSYVFSMRLPNSIGAVMRNMLGESGRINIGAGVSLASDQTLAEGFVLPKGENDLFSLGLAYRGLLSTGHRWDENATYLQIPLNGYTDEYASTATAMLAVERLQSFLGLGLAMRLFRYVPSYSLSNFTGPTLIHHAHRIDKGLILHDVAFGLEAGMPMNMESFQFVDYGPDFPIARFADSVFASMSVCFRHKREAERIMRASQWLATSYMTKNATMAFVQAMIAIEILLGDKRTTDMVGIGELLSNRCAYLIGDSQSDREQVLADFRGLYSVRSEIVHSGKSRLSHSEWIKYNKLLHMCGRSIQEEINLLKKNAPTQRMT